MKNNYVEAVVVVDSDSRKATAQIFVNGLESVAYPVREIRVDGAFYLIRKKGQKPGTKRKAKKRKYTRRAVAA